MLDIKFIRENKEKVKEGARKKQVKVDIDRILELDKKQREFIGKIEKLRAERNEISKNQVIDSDQREKAKKIKEKIKELEPILEVVRKEFQELMMRVPNLPLDEVPEGINEEDNLVLRKVGQLPKFKFQPKDYLTIAQNLDLIDMERGAKVSGARFGYLKREAVLLEFALVQLAFNILTKEGFIPILPPVMIKPEMATGMGYLEQTEDSEAYFLPKDNLYLIGTSEQSVGAMHAGELLKNKDLPRRYIAFSTCFRREAGSYGKDTKGILRAHQFDKIEMFSFSRPEDGREEHQFFLSLEEKLMNLLQLPYQVVQISTGDMSLPSASSYDIETWFPSQVKYRETHSTSNCTDFQARRLDIRYKNKEGKINFVHTLNGTVFSGRPILAILENYQQEDGSVIVPKVLRNYVGKNKITKK